jgi:hypothetical protein
LSPLGLTASTSLSRLWNTLSLLAGVVQVECQVHKAMGLVEVVLVVF